MKYAIGVDIGGTNIRLAIVDEKGNIIQVLKSPTDKSNGKESLLNQIICMFNSLDYSKYDIIGVGVGVPGPVNPQNGDVYVIPNLNITEIPIKSYLENKLNLPVYVGNDANVAALAEAKIGNGKDYNVVQYLTLSTGIGGGLIINGRMVTGHYGFAQEVGNTIIRRGGRRPSIFKPGGCIEGLASGNSLLEIAAENNLSIKHVGELFLEAKNGNKIAQDIKNVWIEDMAAFIGNIVALLEPDIFILGGGLMKSSNLFLDELIKKVDDYVFEFLKGKIRIVSAKYDQDAGIIGAAMQVFN